MKQEPIRVLSLPKYGRKGASSRLRTLQYRDFLDNGNISTSLQPLICDSVLDRRYQMGRYGFPALMAAYMRRIRALHSKSAFDLVWIEKEALPWFPGWLEQALLQGRPYALDYDDAIFHSYALHRNPLVRQFYGAKLDQLMNRARLVVAGNDYLARYASSCGAKWVEVLPTVIDLARYPAPDFSGRGHGQAEPPTAVRRIVWIGSPSTKQYLEQIAGALRELAAKTPFILRVIGAGAVNLPGVDVELLEWSEETEVADISSCDVGIMPLRDTPWERGKCGYKLIQYMACGLPVVASAVGANTDIVRDGVDGLFADGTSHWSATLERLLSDAELREQMGRAGRARVESRYCVQKAGPRLAQLLQHAAKGDR